MSNPVDDSLKNEIQEFIKDSVATFGLEYAKSYATAAWYFARMEARKEPKPWKLARRPDDQPVFTEPLKVGYITKEGAVVKNWKRRWFVVRPDYSVEYWASEEEWKKPKAKPKGVMHLAGYHVNMNPNDTELNRLKALAEKMGLDLSALPKPKEYPPFTIEIYHSRRRPWYIQFQSEQEMKEWVPIFRECCWRAYGLTWKDRCHGRAFPHALWRTRWALGAYGYWSYGGTEEQQIADMIASLIDSKFLHKMYSKLQGPYMVRNKFRENVLKTLDAAVLTAVKPAWAAVEAAAKQVLPKIEPVFKDKATALFEVENDIATKIKEGIMTIIQPAMTEHIEPHTAKIFDIAKQPVSDAFDTAILLFSDAVDKLEIRGANRDELSRSMRELRWLSYWYLYPATDKLDAMYDPLWALRMVFPDIWPSSIIWDAKYKIRRRIDAAAHCFELRLLPQLEGSPALNNPEQLKAVVQSIKAGIIEDLRHDIEIAKKMVWLRIIKDIVQPPFNRHIRPLCQHVIQPLVSALPEFAKTILDPWQTFDDIIKNVINTLILAVVS